MGSPMAQNLQKHLAKKNQSLIFNNRTMSAGDSLKSLGACPASTFGELVSRSNVIFTMASKPVSKQRVATNKEEKSNRSTTTTL
jgi:3-hydroxyisobutyrate dehydrogenase-like beta-hydroxyacid dehydrogenase